MVAAKKFELVEKRGSEGRQAGEAEIIKNRKSIRLVREEQQLQYNRNLWSGEELNPAMTSRSREESRVINRKKKSDVPNAYDVIVD